MDGDERGTRGGRATEQFGDVSVVDISCLHVPFALQEGRGGINEASDAQLGRSWRHLLSLGVGVNKERERGGEGVPDSV